MFGYSLLRLGFFVALAIVACTLVGLLVIPPKNQCMHK